MRASVAGILLLLAGEMAGEARAQQPDDPSTTDAALSYLNEAVSGRVGMTAEAYGVSGISRRRPAASMRTYASTSFNLFGLRSGLNLTYSTEGNELRQSMNRLSFSTRWGWGRASAGSVSPSLSAYSLNGETARGGFLELTPGPLRLSGVFGRTQRAVAPGTGRSFRQAAYARWLYAGRLGLGDQTGTHFHLVGVVARDDTTSLDAPGSEVLPQENVSLTPSLGLSLFDEAFQLQAQVTPSAFSRDTRADAFDLSDTPVPGFVTSFFTPRTSTRLDWAGKARVELNLQRFRVEVGYDRIQPGFRSLGAGRLRSDQETISVRPRVRLLGGKLNLSGRFRRTRNNLLGNHITTRNRTQIGLNAQVRLSRAVGLSGSYQQMNNATEPTASAQQPDQLRQSQVTRTATLSPTLTLRAGPTTHNVSLSGTWQTFANEHPASQGTSGPDLGFTNLTTTLTYGLALPSGWSLNSTANWLRKRGGGTETDVLGLNAGTGYTLFEGALTLNVSGGYSQTTNALQPVGAAPGGANATTRTSRQFTLNGSGAYQLPWGSRLRLSVRGRSNQGAGNRSYQEVRSQLRYEHQF
jgi:hypothetical protein